MNDVTTDQVQKIEEFLANWRVAAAKYYNYQADTVREIKAEYLNLLEKYNFYSVPHDWRFLFREDGTHPFYPDDYLAAKKAVRDWSDANSGAVVNLVGDMNMNGGKNKEVVLDKFLTKQVDIKRKQFVSKVKNIVGEITDASGLRIGVDGNINGNVIGTDNTCSVQSIYAGGYNIQCLHYRVLVRVSKEK